MHRSLEVHSTAASGASRVIDDELSDSLGSRHKVEDVKRAIELELGEGSPFNLFRVNPSGSIGDSLRATSWDAVDFNTNLLPVPVSSDSSPPTFRQETDSGSASVGMSSIAPETALQDRSEVDGCKRVLSRSRRTTGSHMHTPPSTRPSSVHSEDSSAGLGAFSPVTVRGDVGRNSNTGRRGAARPAGTATPPIRSSSCSRNTPPTAPVGASDLETRLHRAQSHHHLSDSVDDDDAYLPLASTFAESPSPEPSSAQVAIPPPLSPTSTAHSEKTTSRRLLAVTNALQALSAQAPGRRSEREERSQKPKRSNERRTGCTSRSPSASRPAFPARPRPSVSPESSQQRPLSPFPHPTLTPRSGSLAPSAPVPSRPVQQLRFAVPPSPAEPSVGAVSSRAPIHAPHTRVEPTHAPWVTVSAPKVQSQLSTRV